MSSIKLKHSGGNSVSLNPPTSAPTSTEVAFKLPNADGSSGQFLKTDGSTNLSFATVATTEAVITGKLSSSSHIQQTVASGLTYNGTTGDQSLGSVSNATASSIKSLVCFVQCVHSSSSASHGYLTGWIYQTGKTYNVDGGYFDVRTYNQYVLHFPTTVIIPWDTSGTQSLNLYINSSTETGSNNYFNIGVDSKLENV
ncbi:MAG: hypothetical protein CBC57_07120 [Euryarchaeota archaeon TMED97]|nr:MAG: hypothetical protein CBC57_07120 [Euryarchaeota archaeon TMED97]|tara:strand:+ start:1048 stop:1641 length:594 start_codon:yes stop_codon:yes gene_type:complete